MGCSRGARISRRVESLDSVAVANSQIMPNCASHFWPLIFKTFSPPIGKLLARFATRFSRFGHGCFGQPALIRRPSVPHKLSKASVSGDGTNFVGGTAGLGQAPRRRFAQSMRRAMRQASLITSVPKPMTEARSLERSTESGGQERQVTARGGGNDGRKLWMDWNNKLGTGLFLLDVQCTITVVLRSHADDVTAALAGINQ